MRDHYYLRTFAIYTKPPYDRVAIGDVEYKSYHIGCNVDRWWVFMPKLVPCPWDTDLESL